MGKLLTNAVAATLIFVGSQAMAAWTVHIPHLSPQQVTMMLVRHPEYLTGPTFSRTEKVEAKADKQEYVDRIHYSQGFRTQHDGRTIEWKMDTSLIEATRPAGPRVGNSTTIIKYENSLKLAGTIEILVESDGKKGSKITEKAKLKWVIPTLCGGFIANYFANHFHSFLVQLNLKKNFLPKKRD